MIKKKNTFTLTPSRSNIAIASSLFTVIISTNVLAEIGDPTVWRQQILGGEMLFYDWGYRGPQGQNASEWDSNGTFDGAAQIQHVITTDADRETPDASPDKIITEFVVTPLFRVPNMDTQTNFYKWGYTTTGGSTFNNMQIDSGGDYLIKREDMTFNYYNTFDYQYDGTEDLSTLLYNAPEGINPSGIQFQPYAMSDARGWCGSVSATNPAALEAMAGQVTFDFGFEVYLPVSPKDSNGIGIPGLGSMQIIKDFQMRSYGSLEVNISVAGGGVADLVFKADAVVNNTSPLNSTIPDTVPVDSEGKPVMINVPILNMDGTPAVTSDGTVRTKMVDQNAVGGGGVDLERYNEVSFMGGGIIPPGAWLEVVDPAGRISNANIVRAVKVGLEADGSPEPFNSNVIYHQNSFANYPFLLRADGIRVLDAMDFSLYTNQSGIPASGFDTNGNLINLEGNIVTDISDSDADGVLNSVDNCPDDANADQTNTDGLPDGGDACDSDDDQDGTPDVSDAFPLDAAEDADSDSDTIGDNADNCPNTANTNQNDSGGVDSNSPDGIGDVCQCGDISGDGKITNTDSVLIRRHLLGKPSNFYADFCDVNGDSQCTNTDAILIQRALLGLPPGLQQSCVAAGN